MRRFILSIMILVSVAGVCAAAEQKAAQQKLEPIVVTASRVSDRWIEYPSSAGVTAATKAIDVIDSEQIARSGARNVPELLKNQVGIEVREYMGNGKTAQVDVRGFGETAQSNVLVMIDGRRTNQIDMSGVDWLQIDINSIERIEIIRTSQAVLYGDNAVGGVINIVTKRGTGKKPEIGGSYETGSYHYNSGGGYAMGGSDFMDYYVSCSARSTDGYRGNSDLETSDFNGTFTVRPSDWVGLRCDSGYHRDWYGLPGAVTDMQIERDGWRACDTPTDRGKTEDFYVMPGFDLHNKSSLGSLTLSADFPIRDQRSAALYNSWGFWSEFNNHITTFGATPKVVFESLILNMPNRMVAGVDYYQYTDKITSFNFANLRVKDNVDIDEYTAGVYISDTLNPVENLTLSGGFRAEWAGVDIEQHAVATVEDNKRMYEYAFDAGLDCRYNERSAVYATIARSFRFPAVDEWYQVASLAWGGGLNLDLVPQTGMEYEVGIRDNTIKWLKLMASYFVLDMKHELYFDPYAAGANGVHDHTMRHGLELEAHVMPVKDLDIYGKYTFEKAFFVGSHYAGNEMPLVPENKFTGGLTYTFMDCVDVNYVFTFVGDRRFISDQLNLMRKMKYYIINDIRVGYRKHGFEVYGVLNNIFNYHYSDIGSRGQYYPAYGRNFLFGVKQKF